MVQDGSGGFTLDLADIPALPDEDWMPPLNTYKWRVSFFYSNFNNAQDYWAYAGRGWAAFVLEFTKATGTLKTAVAGIVSRGDSDLQMAQKIYAAVLKRENTDFTRRKSHVERTREKIRDIHNAQDVWREQSGSSDEITLLFVALCRTAGLSVEPMRVVDRSRALFDPGHLSARQFDDYIAVGQFDGKDVFPDPGEKVCPFGMLHWRHTLSSGFRLTGLTAAIARTPAGGAKSSSVGRVGDLTIDETGKLQGTVRIILSGQEALRWRQFALIGDEDEVKKRFNEWMAGYLAEGIHGDFDHFLGLDQYDATLMGVARVSGNLGTVTGRRIFLPGLFFESGARHPFAAQETRTVPVDVQFAKLADDGVTYRLAAGYAVESSPTASAIEWPDHAKFSIVTTVDEAGIDIVRSLATNYTMVDPKDYGSLHSFYQKLAAADQQQVVLVRAPQPKGN